MSLLAELNSQQQNAVKAPPGIVRVIAVAGSGKTSVLTHKIAYEIQNGISPEKIVALTFTKKAGTELKQRLRKMIGMKVEKLFAGTFHSFAHQHLMKVLNYTILPENDIADIISGIKERYEPYKKTPTREIVTNISYHRNRRKPFEDPFLDSIAVEYKKEKVDNNWKDFDDLLEDFLLLLKKDFFHFNYKLILTDESQDNNRIQIEIVKELMKDNKNLFVTGDAAQSIYAFRGADLESFIDWEKEGCTDYPLAVNYRSTKEIAKIANRILDHMAFTAKVKIISIRDSDNVPKVRATKVQNARTEAAYIVNKIEELIYQGHKPSSIAILYRAHFISTAIQMKLAEKRIEFTTWSGQNLLNAAHIQDTLCALRAFTTKKDILAWTRIFQLLPKIGRIKGQRLAQEAIQGNFTDPTIQYIFSQNNNSSFFKSFKDWYIPILKEKYPDENNRVEGVKNFISFAESQPDLRKFISDVMLYDKSENEEEDKVILSTIHSSKGLEWENVFISGIYDGVFPNYRNEDQDEELRLYYVAVTRAKTNLFLTFPQESRNGPTKNSFLDLILNKKEN